VDWETLFRGSDAEQCYESFLEVYRNVCEKFVPMRKAKNLRSPLWINKDLKKLIRLKHSLWYKSKSMSSKADMSCKTVLRNRYEEVSKSLKKEIRKSVSEFESKLAKSSVKNP